MVEKQFLAVCFRQSAENPNKKEVVWCNLVPRAHASFGKRQDTDQKTRGLCVRDWAWCEWGELTVSQLPRKCSGKYLRMVTRKSCRISSNAIPQHKDFFTCTRIVGKDNETHLVTFSNKGCKIPLSRWVMLLLNCEFGVPSRALPLMNLF